jgi:hypothetical protein
MLVIIAPFFHRLFDDVNDFAPLVLVFFSRIFLIVIWTMLLIGAPLVLVFPSK